LFLVGNPVFRADKSRGCSGQPSVCGETPNTESLRGVLPISTKPEKLG
jgi:hypothetical protein